MDNPKIKFSHEYEKMPLRFKYSRLLQAIVVHKIHLSKEFIEYDTKIVNDGNYDLSYGPLIFLILQVGEGGHIWTTLREYDQDKFNFYRSMEGQYFDCVIVEALK